MPVRTSTNKNGDDIDVRVDDDGTGGPRQHIVDVMVSWDPSKLRYVSSTPPARRLTQGTRRGVIVWMKYAVSDTAARTFSVKLRCRRRGTHHVMSVAQDCAQICMNGPHSHSDAEVRICGQHFQRAKIPKRKA
jgi:hypothetical protein